MLLLMMGGVIATLQFPLVQIDPDSPAGADLDLYRGIIHRMRAGQDYYTAAGTELRTPRGPGGTTYPTRSVLNWRLPTLAWFSSVFPSDDAVQAAFGLLAALVWLAWFERLRREGSFGLALAGGLVILPACLWAVPAMGGAYLFHEAWSGFLIALSIAVRGSRGAVLAIALGAAALAVRELALAYVVVAAAWAWWERQRAETLGWLLVILVFLAAWGCHAGAVAAQGQPGDHAHARGWVQFGGWWFVLKTAMMNVVLIVAPGWVTALVFPLALLGFTQWRSATGRRVGLTVLTFVLAYLVVGQPFNYMWGLMYAPLWPLGWLTLPACFGVRVAAAPGTLEPLGNSE